ncbi:MAG: radical SAM protein [Candidatus Omnitrophica bacterium]|nr:radical SAM protein [Candidatus Omnitrophota bacterium]
MDLDDFFRGIEEGKKAYCGPRVLQLDITNNCNTNCVGCWCHSDYLGKKQLKGKEKKIVLCLDTIKKIIDDAWAMNVGSIHLAGSGEPLMHPDICSIVEYIKKKDMSLEIVTNGLLLNKKMCQCLVDNKVDKVAVSVWAGSLDTYHRIHPNQPREAFDKLKENLSQLCALKRKKYGVPSVRIYHVISNYNFYEIEKMIEFGIEVEANMVEFQAIDIIPGKTDFLAMDEKQISAIEQQFKKMKKRKDCLVVNRFDTEEFNEFGRFIIKNNQDDGFVYYFDNTFFYETRCPIGRTTYSIRENLELGHIEFIFSKNICQQCVRLHECTIHKEYFLKVVYFLSVVGVNTFLRRIKAVKERQKTEYDSNVDKLPCYAGWDFARILTNGNVIPCCKGYLRPLGNIYKDSFKTIWMSRRYDEFRKKGKSLKKSDPYFKEFECLKGCDNYGRNVEISRKLCTMKLQGVLL